LPSSVLLNLRKEAVNTAGAVKLGFIKEDPMSTELLRASEAARRLRISTKDLLRLVHGREIRYQMVDGIAHIPTDALEEYRARAS
jgi:excisionase family DNA binding protein